MSGDDRIRDLFQAAYDHAWDRWGVYLGTFRMWMAVIGCGVGIGRPTWDVLTGKPGSTIPAFLALCVTFAALWIYLGRRHMGEEWTLQHEGRYEKLNRRSLKERVGEPYFRLTTVGLIWMIGAVLSNGLNEQAMAALTAICILPWTYSRELLVRERDARRFEERKLATTGAGGRA